MNKLSSFAFLLLLSVCAFAQPCSDLFISEYVEGSSNNKAIELYNPTAAPVDLTGYKLQLYANGSATPTSTLNLAGTVAAGDVYVVVNSQASAAIKAVRDTSSSVSNFNGDDAIALLSGTTIIDLIGEIGTDPGTEWDVDTGTTLNHTLVRKISVQEGSANWTTGATEWDVLPQDSIQLGAHTMNSCAAPADTTARFSPVSASAAETAGTYNINVALNQTVLADKTVDIALQTGDAADIGNFTTTTVTIMANSANASFALTITNDTIAEGAEQFSFVLTNPSAGLLLDDDSVFTLTILDDDSIAPPAPLYPIATVTTVDADGVADSLGVKCRVTGVVYGINLRDSGLQFTIHDGTGGMGVFSSTNNFGYTVAEGDSIIVSGEVGQFAGFTQMQALDTVIAAGTGALQQPTVTTVLDENSESELVRINRVWLLDANQWDNSNPSGFTVDVTNGTDTYELRIEEQVDLFNEPAPTSSFDVIGLVSQFDNSSPYTSGYQILPRSADDLILHTSIAGVKENAAFSIFPNPATGSITLHLDRQQEATALHITDMAGKIVVQQMPPFSSDMPISLQGIGAGNYFVTLFTPQGATIQRLTVLSAE